MPLATFPTNHRQEDQRLENSWRHRLDTKFRNPLSLLLACALLLLVLSGTGGCKSFRKSGKDAASSRNGYSPLASATFSQNVAALEIAVAQLDGAALEEFEKVWSKADVQMIPLDLRKRLDQNGIRVGLLGTQLPGELTEALNWSQPLINQQGDAVSSTTMPLKPVNGNGTFAIKQIEQLDAGESHWVPCSSVVPTLDWMVKSDSTVRSGNCELAQCGFEISQIPENDNTIKLWFRPEVRHGDNRMRYAIDEETLLIQEQQKHLRLNELDFHHRVRLGQTLIITCVSRPEGIGKHFFGSGQFSTTRHVLLIRPIRMGKDDLFGSGHTSRRLSTSLD